MTEGGAAIVELGAAAAAERVRSGELSRAELFDTYRDRAAHDDTGAFLSVAQAPNAPGEGPLAGVPLAVKDVFCVEGVESTAQLALLADWGCDLYQGFIGAGPLDEAELARFVTASMAEAA